MHSYIQSSVAADVTHPT